jgi:hypothetical protein
MAIDGKPVKRIKCVVSYIEDYKLGGNNVILKVYRRND